jgi:hypothetical protein
MIQIEPLNLKKATELFLLIGKYIPEEIDEDMLNFISKILKNIQSSGEVGDYLKATSMMTGFTEVDLTENYSPKEVLEIFTEGLVANKVIGMVDFFKKIGFSNG